MKLNHKVVNECRLELSASTKLGTSTHSGEICRMYNNIFRLNVPLNTNYCLISAFQETFQCQDAVFWHLCGCCIFIIKIRVIFSCTPLQLDLVLLLLCIKYFFLTGVWLIGQFGKLFSVQQSNIFFVIVKKSVSILYKLAHRHDAGLFGLLVMVNKI